MSDEMEHDEVASEEEVAGRVVPASGPSSLLGGGVALPDFGNLLSQLTSATERLENAASEVRAMVIQGTSAGGAVTISLSGELEALEVRIAPSLVDPSDVGMLEDSVLAALRDVLQQYSALQAEIVEAMPGPGIDLSGMLGSLSGMLGNLGDPEHMPGGMGGGLGAIFGDLMGATEGTGSGGLRRSRFAGIDDDEFEDVDDYDELEDEDGFENGFENDDDFDHEEDELGDEGELEDEDKAE